MNINVITEHAKCVLVALFVIASVGLWGVETYLERMDKIEEKETRLENREEKLNEKMATLSEKDKQLAIRETEINNQMEILQAKASRLEVYDAELRRRESGLEEQESKYSSAALRAQHEQEINLMIEDFSKLGVSLDSQPECGDAEGRKSYNQAKILWEKIRVLTSRYNLSEDYRSFIEATSPGIVWLQNCSQSHPDAFSN